MNATLARLEFRLEDEVDGHLSNVLPVSQVVDEEVLKKLWEKGSIAWQQVDDATAWVEKIRGH
ncbi:MAG: hypothetical protein WCS65_03260 [Verrucomicrobiae bacterium]